MSGCARPRTTGARWDRARDPARDARGSVWTDEGAARICGVGRKQAQAAAAQRGQRTSLSSLCWWPQLTTVAGCENWRQPDEAVKFHYPSNGDGCRRKSAKGPARCTHQGFALEMYQHSVLNSPTPIFPKGQGGGEEHSQLYKDKHTRPHSETQILYETLHRPTLHVLHRNAVPLDHAFHGATNVRHDWSTSG
jgi:hypothetical protein